MGEGDGVEEGDGAGEGDGVEEGDCEGAGVGFTAACGVGAGKGVPSAIGAWFFDGKIKTRKAKNRPADIKSASITSTKAILLFATRIERMAYNVRILKSNLFIRIGCTL